MLKVVLFRKANVWKRHQHLLTKEWINKLWHYSYNLDLHSSKSKWTRGACIDIDEFHKEDNVEQ